VCSKNLVLFWYPVILALEAFAWLLLPLFGMVSGYYWVKTSRRLVVSSLYIVHWWILLSSKNKGLLFLFFFILEEFYLLIPCYWRVLNLVPKQYLGKLTDARQCSPKSMVPIFIVHARRGLLGIAVLVVAVSVSRVLFGPWVLAPMLGCLTELSTCPAVSTSPTCSARLVVAALVVSSCLTKFHLCWLL
jgi:hypothetical protein